MVGAQLRATSAPGKEATGREAGRVLVVSDDRHLRQMLAAIGAEEGYVVETTEWREEALGQCLSTEQHLVMVDWVSPPLVMPLISQVRRQHGSARIVVMVPSWSELEPSARLAADHVLHKPLRVNQVRRVLAEALAPERHPNLAT